MHSVAIDSVIDDDFDEPIAGGTSSQTIKQYDKKSENEGSHKRVQKEKGKLKNHLLTRNSFGQYKSQRREADQTVQENNFNVICDGLNSMMR